MTGAGWGLGELFALSNGGMKGVPGCEAIFVGRANC